jgi:broad specificity phosphatase PhoE
MPAVYYLRHGETAWNAAKRLQGRHDSPLSALGESQAIRCAEILRDLFAREERQPGAFDYVSSPLGRACRTMALVRTALDLPPDAYRTDPRLAEISFGAWEGLTLEGVRARDAQLLAAREHDKWGFLPPGGESYAQVAERIGEWHDSITRDTVVTAHGGTARALFAHLGISPTALAPLADIDQGVVYVFADGNLSRYG